GAERVAGDITDFAGEGLDVVIDFAGFGTTTADAMNQLLDSGVTPDAVFAYNDLIAIGAMRVLSERGLRVPDDVAVVGFDDITEGRYGAVTLTTISPDKQTIARLAVRSVVNRLLGTGDPVSNGSRELRADFRLVERESTLGRRRDGR
ncbi:substrate-binding domain-containing protein, partial [Streptomyces niveus]|uniref:substrate-binding domain-containing protein n=1 Tax=Streptomyces niveus TaxID=193462 RepID=UPI003439E76D